MEIWVPTCVVLFSHAVFPCFVCVSLLFLGGGVREVFVAAVSFGWYF